MKKILSLTMIVVLMLSSCGTKNETAKLNDTKIDSANVQVINKSNNELETDNYVSTIVSEASWAYDVFDPAEVLQHNDFVIKVRVNTKEKAKFEMTNAPIPKVRYNVEVLDVLYGEEYDMTKNVQILFEGGEISSQDLYGHVGKESAEKMGLDKKSLENILIINDAYYEMEQDNEYYLVVRKTDEKNVYALPSVGYNIFYESEGRLYNVLTDNELILE